MERDERQQLRATTSVVTGWASQALAILSHRAKVNKAGDNAVSAMLRAVAVVPQPGEAGWGVMLFRHGDGRYLSDIAGQNCLPAVSRDDFETLEYLIKAVVPALRAVKPLLDAQPFFSGSSQREAAIGAADFLRWYRDTALTLGTPEKLRRLTEHEHVVPTEVPLADALADWVGLSRRVVKLGMTQELLPVATVSQLPWAIETIERALAEEARFRSNALASGEAVRKSQVSRLLARMPVMRLREAARDRLLIGPLTKANITTVQAVLDLGANLQDHAGIGSAAATRIRGAAQTLWQTTYDETPVRIDIKDRTSEVTELLRRFGAWDAARKIKVAASDLALAEALTPLAQALDTKVSQIALLSSARSAAEFRESVEAVGHLARQIADARGASTPNDPWEDFLQRPADYFALLAELGFITEDEQKTHGDLPDEIVETVRKLELDTQNLSASLRGYQSFGARFALVQRKVIIGDEMGLGKTVEALAVLAHLRSKGFHHALVICPAAVVTNWIREVQSKSRLQPHRMHGLDRDAAARNWVSNGGVAVTTFESLGWFASHVLDLPELGCVVVDEAHYIKNPNTLRAERTTRLIDACNRVVLLTGTPLENRIDEFRNLVGYLRPDLVVEASELAPRRFRRQVASAYLRRNQEDVLTELPELVEVDEWLPMSRDDAAAYLNAVAAGNFMAMRQAAMSQGGKSEKMRRLVEIVKEAEDNGRRVIVFSHFRDVLDQVTRALPSQVFGPLTGSVPAAARQVIVDQFAAAAHGAVLVSQILSGGVGLNIQAASAVVICEPQLKPTTEWQAIARAHRMGQLESVQVHRLLSEEGVDLRITEILRKKRELFNEFARMSEMADNAPEAFDVSEADLAREVVAAERERLFATSPEAVPPIQSE